MKTTLIASTAALATLFGSAVAATAAPPTSAGAKLATSVDISYPSAGDTVPVGDLHVLGTAGSTAPRATDHVLFVTDVSSSTTFVDGMDCNGDGAADGDDDLNVDGSIGDILDCEIAGIQALNRDLGTIPGAATGVRVGIEAFGSNAAVAQMSAASGEEFVAPGRADGSVPNVGVVATSLTVGAVDEYVHHDVGGATDFDDALDSALGALAGVSGNKWVFFMSDGEATVGADTLAAVTASGARVRTYAVGHAAGSDACDGTEPLGAIAVAGSESCTIVSDPSKLAANLTGSQPDDIDSVVVSGLGADITASVDSLGNWDAFAPGLTAGSYTATATAEFTDGSSATDTVTFTVAAAPDHVERWAGADRYEASADISRQAFNPGVRRAFIASGLIFTDALSGSPVAGDTPGPMLLVKTDEIPSAIAAELTRLKPQEIVVLGGPNTISRGVETALGSSTAGRVLRWDGADRYVASAKISASTFGAGVDTAYIASGLIFTDALSGSPIAGKTPGPMLLVKTDEIPDAIKTELRRLKPKEIVVLGGPATITDLVQRDLDAYTTGPVDRWDGLDRYEASAKISAKSFRPGVDTAFIASGLVFTDALSGSAIAGDTPGPMLLVKTNEIPPSIETELQRLKPKRIVILGGTNTITSQVETDLESFVRRAG